MIVGFELQPVLGSRSGVGWYTHELVRETVRLASEGHPPDESSRMSFEGYLFDFPGKKASGKPDLPASLTCRTNTLMPYGLYRRLWNACPVSYNRLMHARADLLHFFNFVVPPKVDGRVIVTVHDMAFRVYPETLTEANRRRLEQNLERSVRRADAIVTLSMNSKNDIMRFLNVSPDRIHIIPPGVDLERFRSEPAGCLPADLLRANRLVLPERYILYLGTLEPRKNVPALLRAFASIRGDLPGVRLVLAGGAGWMREELDRTIVELGIGTDVVFTGYVDETDKPELYRRACAFAFPSLYEGFGMPVLEAMACGVPVVASCASSIPEVTGDAALLVDPKSDAALATALFEACTNGTLRERMIRDGLAQAGRFTWTQSAERLLALYGCLEGGST